MSSRKDQILDVALSLFMDKGFDDTSISDILANLDIARGTLYYHFESKEAIMDAIIERLGDRVVLNIEQVIKDKHLSVYDKFYEFFAAMNISSVAGEQMLYYLHRPQNALFHEKSNQMIFLRISPLLAQIIVEGVEQGLFNTEFPLASAEMILIIIVGFLNEYCMELPAEDFVRRVDALVYVIERILGAKSGSFNNLKKLVLA